MLKGNKGEWSELYVLLKLMSDGVLYQSDINMSKDYNNIYNVIKAYKNESKFNLEFRRNEFVDIYRTNDLSNKIHSISLEDIDLLTRELFKHIKNGKGKSFEIPEISDFINKSQITKLKADSTTKTDIDLRIYDTRLAKETDLGFSIKSLIGKNSTLFNTGRGNNFIYKISGDYNLNVEKFNAETYSPKKGKSKIAERIQRLEADDFKIKFDKIQSPTLWKNLKMIDGDLPDIIATALYYRWLYQINSLEKICEILEESDPLNFYNGEKSQQKFYEYKMKKFLTESAMGMTSEKLWFGEYHSFGGVIVVKDDGEVLCFHIYDFNVFRDYLLKNTKFEQPATGEDADFPGNEIRTDTNKKYYYGWVYDDNGLKIKINLQVRFK